MKRTATRIKKNLCFETLIENLSSHFQQLEDPRQTARCLYSLNDTAMSAFGCMFFQDTSLLQFQERMQVEENANNLRNLLGVKTIPKDTQLRDTLDEVPSESFRPLFKQITHQLQRGKHLESFQIIPGYYLCAIDGVTYHSSQNIHCEKCLTQQHKNGTVTYKHGALQGAIMHPDMKQVFPLMPEFIANSDGQKKQDCEINAAKRFISALKKDHPRLGLIITGDGLFSKDPMIQTVLDASMHFLFVAKPDDHVYMMEWIKTASPLPEVVTTDAKHRQHRYRYMNHVPLNGKENAQWVNVIFYELINENGDITYKNSWVTDIEVNHSNVQNLARGGRCRWKIENECFNTLKNQGYSLEHNFGHGKKHLCHNMYLFILLAFTFHQVLELTDPVYQYVRRAHSSKRGMWEAIRGANRFVLLTSWNDMLLRVMKGRGGIPFLEKI